MNFLHKELQLAEGEVLEVTINNPANVLLLDQPNYELYRRGKPYRYHGGHATNSPVSLPAPSAGRWHLVVDLGGGAGTVRASLSILSAQPA